MYNGVGGRSIGMFEINLLRTSCVDIECRIRPKYAAYAPLFWLLLEGKDVVCPVHGWFWKF